MGFRIAVAPELGVAHLKLRTSSPQLEDLQRARCETGASGPAGQPVGFPSPDRRYAGTGGGDPLTDRG